jgi:hypothetical protein
VIPELTRPFPRERVGEGTQYVVEANAQERVALARRMGLPEIHALRCTFHLHRGEGAAIPATGLLRARVTQVCVVSLEPFDADIADEFAIRFVPQGTETDELDLDAVDEVPYAGNVLDLGEAAAEQLALALDPFPRKPGAVLPEDPAADPNSPFSDLGKLRQSG